MQAESSKLQLQNSSWLLTWNPLRFQEADPQYALSELYQDLLQVGFAITKWSCGVNTSIKFGDKVFLMRLGQEPRGIVASGIALSDVFTGTHWDEERRSKGVLAKRIYVKFDDIRLGNTGVLPIETLQEKFPNVFWSPQASGMRIPENVSASLMESWQQCL